MNIRRLSKIIPALTMMAILGFSCRSGEKVQMRKILHQRNLVERIMQENPDFHVLEFRFHSTDLNLPSQEITSTLDINMLWLGGDGTGAIKTVWSITLPNDSICASFIPSPYNPWPVTSDGIELQLLSRGDRDYKLKSIQQFNWTPAGGLKAVPNPEGVEILQISNKAFRLFFSADTTDSTRGWKLDIQGHTSYPKELTYVQTLYFVQAPNDSLLTPTTILNIGHEMRCYK